MYKTERNSPILFSFVFFLLLGMVLFGCGNSNKQERQITNAFSPGQIIQEATPQTQLSGEISTPTEAAAILSDIPAGTAAVSSPQPTDSSLPPAIVTQTRAATMPNQPAVTNTPSKKPANSATATVKPSNTPTVTLTPSPTLLSGWAGDWIAYLAQSDGTYRSGTLTVTISGDSVIGVFDNGGISMNLEGSYQTDKSFVSGDYTLPSSDGFFKWRIEENFYLIGNIDNEWAFCAAREGFPQPDPCGYFDPL